MVKVIVEVTAECESLISSMPRGSEYEMAAEDYNEDGSGFVTFFVHGVDELPSGMEQALNANDEVISYSVA